MKDTERWGFERMCVMVYPEDRARIERLLKRDRLDGVNPAACNQSALIRRALEFYERLTNPLGTVRQADPPPRKGKCAWCGAMVRFAAASPILREHTEGLAGLSTVRGTRCDGSGQPAAHSPKGTHA